jgi:Ca-activated chloride channel family protein
VGLGNKLVKAAAFQVLLGLSLVLASTSVRGQTAEDHETVKINSDLVNLNISVFSRKPGERVQELKQSDFAVTDDGEPQEISFFASTSAPFDLILMLDLSGSTSEKLNLIRKSSIGFVNAARPVDRIGIVTFTNETKVVSPLTGDRAKLVKKIKEIKKPNGGTSFWDALAFVLTDIVAKKNDGRRVAIIAMTDGVDNALPGVRGDGSKIDFLHLDELIRGSTATILPIYLDTEEEETRYYAVPKTAYELAKKSLAIIASESGGIAFRANKLEDLKGVYDSVFADLGNVYSLGYQPAAGVNKGRWHKVRVEVLNRPDLAARTRPGYLAR